MGNVNKDGELGGPNDIANEIILTRDYPGNEFLSFLLVEGHADRNFYKTFADTNKCEITIAHNEFDARSTVLGVLSILEENSVPGVLAIVDADFDILEGKSPHSPNLLFTDTHDLETMLIKSPALEKVLIEFGSEKKIKEITKSTKKDVRTLLLECGMTIGYLRWVSLRENLSLKFEGLEFAQFIKKDALHIEQLHCLQVVKNKSLRHNIADTQLETYIRDLRDDTHDPWHVCCGHDLVCILSTGLRKIIGTWDPKDVKPDNLERSFRLAFERSYFYKTQLYLSIRQWETVNMPFVILVSA
jgi:hypothetical protein